MAIINDLKDKINYMFNFKLTSVQYNMREVAVEIDIQTNSIILLLLIRESVCLF